MSFITIWKQNSYHCRNGYVFFGNSRNHNLLNKFNPLKLTPRKLSWTQSYISIKVAKNKVLTKTIQIEQNVKYMKITFHVFQSSDTQFWKYPLISLMKIINNIQGLNINLNMKNIEQISDNFVFTYLHNNYLRYK